MANTLRRINKLALRQRGWWLFAAIIVLQGLFIFANYLLQSA